MHNFRHIPKRLKILLRDIVLAQDAGIPIYEDLAKERYTLSVIDSLMQESDIERIRMRHEGLPVYVRDHEGLVIDIDNKLYKQPGDPLPTFKTEIDDSSI